MIEFVISFNGLRYNKACLWPASSAECRIQSL